MEELDRRFTYQDDGMTLWLICVEDDVGWP
jgi:hypothetical protein